MSAMKKKSVVFVMAAVAAFAAWAAVPVEFKVETDHADWPKSKWTSRRVTRSRSRP